MQKTEGIFWTTVVISFVLLVHNGLEPLFIFAYALLALLIFFFYCKRSLWPLAFYLLIFGALGRYTRYWRQNYASDVLLVTRDFIGLLLAGKNPYTQLVYSAKGLTPFIYLPFELLWYLPAQILAIDLRFFEMMIACLVPLQIFLYGFLTKKWQVLPALSVVSLTPFLLDLSADGSNDNSAIFLLLLSVLLFVRAPFWSAVVLGLALGFKHYTWFYFFFLAVYFWPKKRKYLATTLLTVALFILPFVLTAPQGFLRAQFYIENRPGHPLWGWNIWNVLKTHFVFSDAAMQLVRTIAVLAVMASALFFWKLDRLNKVFIATSVSLFVYLVLSKWTSYAYFTFLIPLICLSAIEIDN